MERQRWKHIGFSLQKTAGLITYQLEAYMEEKGLFGNQQECKIHNQLKINLCQKQS